MKKVNVLQQFEHISEYWSPRIAAALNGQHVKLVKFKGPFVWHHHDHEDEMFFVIKGSFTMELRDQQIELQEGDFLVVPKGTEHRPNATEEVWVMLFEPDTTLNTGNTINELTAHNLQHI